MLLNQLDLKQNPLRDTITKAYRMDEAACIENLLKTVDLGPDMLAQIQKTATNLVLGTRQNKKKQAKINAILEQYDLSTEEGIALMCLAEALLRIPDATTLDKFISDKLSTANWKKHIKYENSIFINATTWSLLLTGKIFAPTLKNEKNLLTALQKVTSRLGAVMVRPIIMQMMKILGKQFVMGEDINSALKRAQDYEAKGYRFSYDMLGEAARTQADVEHYYAAYETAIHAIGKAKQPHDSVYSSPGISVKLSALHARYEFSQYEKVMQQVVPQLLALARLAKQYNIGFTVDAEEADRLDLSLDIFSEVFKDPALDGWDGFGLALQAYQKRAFFVIDWLVDLAKKHNKKMMVRLVKGAYWDSEIKTSQVAGFTSYPVFTRKNSTDVSYLACARKMLAYQDYIYPQFGTHNAYSIAAIMAFAGDKKFEFQCLHGMGQALYDQIVAADKYHIPVRIYAPVGTHRDLLGYLVRRLLENGANSSFINKLTDDKIPVEKIIFDPVAKVISAENKMHPRIPLPKNIYGLWLNSTGIDLSDRDALSELKQQMEQADKQVRYAGSLINGKDLAQKNGQPVYSPADHDRILGYATYAQEEDVKTALAAAEKAQKTWAGTPYEERAAILEKAAELFQRDMPTLITLLSREGGRCIPDCISEVRETIDYCRYYAYRAREDLKPHVLPGPTGEFNELSLHPRGIIACISPWNFPLAIFTGQVIAALVTGNCVLAKPAEQTPLIAYHAIKILHEAGVPKDVLQLLIGPGRVVGAKIVSDPRTAGVMFTGSTETAKFIEQSLANREGPIGMFIAETGGQNAMIVDSSALPEQTIVDICLSAFNSAGQRCSALRVLFLQDDIAPRFLKMLQGYMAQLTLGDPTQLATDIGPVIDQDAKNMLKEHFTKMSKVGKLIAQVPMTQNYNGTFFAPCAFEIPDISILEGEVFGPFLHIVRFQANQLDKVMESIVKTGFGLTLGIHSRIDATVQYVAKHMPVGNIYVNRNMIGAVVGVQPFGGEGLSGTGPKAGGPHYLPRLCVERTVSNNTTAVGGNARLVSLLEDDE